MQVFPSQQRQGGFSLIELLISIALFSVVITMSVGTMIILLDANAKAQNMNVLMTNLSFSLSSISREIRTGFSYYCGTAAQASSIPSPGVARDCDEGTLLSVVETDNSLTGAPLDSYSVDNRITYYFVANHFSNGNGAILRKLGDGDAFPITSDEIDITAFRLIVAGTRTGDVVDPRNNAHSPRVTMLITGNAGNIEGLDTSFRLQTTVTQRLLDI